MKVIKLSSVCIVLFFCISCSRDVNGEAKFLSADRDSNNIDLYADIVVQDNQAKMSAQFHPSGDIFRDIKLTDGDALFVRKVSSLVSVHQDTSGSGIKYSATFSALPEESFDVIFERPSRSEKHITSLKVPQDFSIVSPSQNTQYTDNDEVVISWASLSGSVSANVFADVSCQNGYKEERKIIRRDLFGDQPNQVDENITYIIDDKFNTKKHSVAPRECDIAISVEAQQRPIEKTDFDFFINATRAKTVNVKFISSR